MKEYEVEVLYDEYIKSVQIKNIKTVEKNI